MRGIASVSSSGSSSARNSKISADTQLCRKCVLAKTLAFRQIAAQDALANRLGGRGRRGAPFELAGFRRDDHFTLRQLRNWIKYAKDRQVNLKRGRGDTR
jgi:hypothetical protein